MSSDGNLIAYNGPNGDNFGASVFLYNASTGSNKDLFPANTSAGNALYNPVLSGDGTHIAMNYEPIIDYIGDNGVVLKAIDGSAVTASNIVAPYDNDATFNYPVSLSAAGNALVYAAENLNQYADDGDFQVSYEVRANGSTMAVPSLGYTNAACTNGASSAELTTAGTALLYTLCFPEFTDSGGYNNYPGVYEWQIP